jgi:hypothetical protein
MILTGGRKGVNKSTKHTAKSKNNQNKFKGGKM